MARHLARTIEDPPIDTSSERLAPLPIARAPVPSSGPASRPLGVVTTGRLEERVWRRFGVRGAVVGVTAGSGSGAAEAIGNALRRGVCGLISFGVAAGLAPAAVPGQLIIADAIALPEGGSRPTDPLWRRELMVRLAPRGLDILEARIAGADAIPGHSLDREKVFRASFAAALDTESHLIADAAHAHGLPFVALRAVIDATRSPRLGTDLLALTPSGRWRRGIVLGLSRPWYATQVLRAAQDLELGLQVLARALPAVSAPPQALAQA